VGSIAGDHQLVFVGGLNRSGASRLTSMLGSHPLVSMLRPSGRGQEAEELQRLFDAASAEAGPDTSTRSPAMRLTETSPACRSATAEELWRLWQPHWDLSKKVLVERSAFNLLRARFLQGLFPDASFIMVIRHPIAVLESAGKGSNGSHSSGLERWVAAYEALEEDAPHLDRLLIVRYERLFADGEGEYRRMLEFLDLPWAPAVTELRLGGNDAYYRSFVGTALTRSKRRSLRDFGTDVERFGYLLRPPFVPAMSVPPRTTTPKALAGSETNAEAMESRARQAFPEETVSGARSSPPPNPESPASRETLETDGSGERSELRRAARGGFAFTGGIFVSAFLGFGFVVLAAHTLNQGAVGALLEAIAIFTICSIPMGAEVGMLRFAPIFLRRRPQDLRRLLVVALGPALVASMLAAVLVFVYAPQLVHIFVHGVPERGSATALRILACFFPAVNLTTVMCDGLRAWTVRAVVMIYNFLQPIARIVILAAFLVLGLTLKLATIAYAVPTAIAFAAAAILLGAKLHSTPTKLGEPVASYSTIASGFWRFSILGAFGLVIQSLIASLDLLLVGAFLSAGLAAAYGVASRYILYGTFALQAIIASVSPQMSRLMDAREYRSAKLVYKSATWWTIAAAWPPLLVLAVFAPLFQSLFGHGYVVAATALTIIALSMLANTGTGPNGALLQMAGRSGVILGIWAIGLAINIGLNVWLIPRMGLVGAAIAWTASIIFITIVTSTILWRSFGFQPFGHGYWIAAGAALGCYGALGLAARLAFGTGVVTFLVYALVSSALYAVLLFRWRSTLNLDAFESLYGGIFRGARKLQATIAGGNGR